MVFKEIRKKGIVLWRPLEPVWCQCVALGFRYRWKAWVCVRCFVYMPTEGLSKGVLSPQTSVEENHHVHRRILLLMDISSCIQIPWKTFLRDRSEHLIVNFSNRNAGHCASVKLENTPHPSSTIGNDLSGLLDYHIKSLKTNSLL